MKSNVLVINNLRCDLSKYNKVFNKIMKETINLLGLEDNLSMSVSFVSENLIRKYNRDYRNIDKITDVISFAMEDSDGFSYDSREIGDIFICYKRAIKQSVDYGHSLDREISFLFTHGLLHLLGYDHMNEEDEKKMFGLQKELLDNYGIKKES